MLNAKEQLEQGQDREGGDWDLNGVINSLQHLRQLGILSEEEFAQKKNDILDRL